jgi:lysophospholipase L1-like esterase
MSPLLLISLCAPAWAQAAQTLPAVEADPPVRPRVIARERLSVVAFGDSVTLGVHVQPGETYPARLQGLLDLRYGQGFAQVINAGIGGNTSGAGLARLERDVLALKPDFVLVNFGLNDSCKTAAGAYRVEPEQFGANLLEIVHRCRAAGAEPVLSTITPVLDEYYFDRHPREFYEPDGGLQPLLARYNAIIAQVAAAEGASLADWRRAMLGHEGRLIRTEENSASRDGVHPTPEGHAVLALECFLQLREQLER